MQSHWKTVLVIHPENEKPFQELMGLGILVNLVSYTTNTKASGSHTAKTACCFKVQYTNSEMHQDTMEPNFPVKNSY